LASSRFMVAKKRSGSGVVNGFGLTTLMSGGGGLVAPGKNKQIGNVNHQIDPTKPKMKKKINHRSIVRAFLESKILGPNYI
jgi:hypothetical protein